MNLTFWVVGTPQQLFMFFKLFEKQNEALCEH